MTAPTAEAGSGEQLRERRKLRTAAEIEEVGLRLFSVRGFDAVAVEEIADEAGMSRRTFFRYFPNKDAVVLSGFRRLFESYQRALETVEPSVSPFESVRRAAMSLAELHEADKPKMVLRSKIMASSPSLLARVIGDQANALDGLVDLVAKRLPADEDPLVAFMLVSTSLAATQATFHLWVNSDETFEAILTRALDVLAVGFDRTLAR
jgi:TetR/AcrR family transcriptional regulator, regulator of mycofactocin system